MRTRVKISASDLHKIYGRIEYVTSFEDYSVRVVDNFADLKVREVESLADAPGKWEIVQELADFRIKLVDEDEDFTITFSEGPPHF